MGRRGKHGFGLSLVAGALLLASSCSGSSTQTATGGASTTAPTATATTGTAAGSTAGSTVGTIPAGGASSTTVATASGSTTPAKATGAAKPSAGCQATSTATVGAFEDITIDMAGTPRTYRRFVPKSATTGVPVPLVLDFHGLTGRSAQEAIVTGWEARAEADHLVVVTPQGAGRVPSWTATPVDDNPDTAFIDALIDKTVAEQCIDESRIYANGISNGGLESSILSCKLPDRIAAVGLVSGIVVPDVCKTVTPKPAVVFWGKLDCVLPYAGGLGPCLFGGKPGDKPPAPNADGTSVPPVEDAVAAWAARNGCDPQPAVTNPGEHVEKRTYTGCQDDAAVELYVVANGGHTWPGSKIAAARDKDPNAPQGITTMEIDATDLIWAFFQRFQTR